MIHVTPSRKPSTNDGDANWHKIRTLRVDDADQTSVEPPRMPWTAPRLVLVHIVDLTRPIVAGMQVYPGDPEPRATIVSTIADDEFELHRLDLGSQTGTHMDAPSHTLVGGGASESVALTRLVGRGVVVDVTDADDLVEGLIGPGPWLDSVGPGDLVLFRADWDRFDREDRAWEHPGLTVELAADLVAREVALVGLDFASVDRHAADLATHRVLAAAGIPVIENMTHLAEVDWPDPLIVILPMSWPGLDGAPVRAIACDLTRD